MGLYGFRIDYNVKVIQMQKDKYYMFSLICSVTALHQNNSLYIKCRPSQKAMSRHNADINRLWHVHSNR